MWSACSWDQRVRPRRRRRALRQVPYSAVLFAASCRFLIERMRIWRWLSIDCRTLRLLITARTTRELSRRTGTGPTRSVATGGRTASVQRLRSFPVGQRTYAIGPVSSHSSAEDTSVWTAGPNQAAPVASKDFLAGQRLGGVPGESAGSWVRDRQSWISWWKRTMAALPFVGEVISDGSTSVHWSCRGRSAGLARRHLCAATCNGPAHRSSCQL